MASSRSKKEEIIAEVKREIAVQNFSLLVEKIQKNCFRLCVPTPGAKLDSSETTCTQRCSDSYVQAWNLVSVTLLKRLQRDASGH